MAFSSVVRRRAFILERRCPKRRPAGVISRFRPVELSRRNLQAETLLPSSSSGALQPSPASGGEDHRLGLLTLLGMGFAVTSSWRGLWYIMDGTIFPDNLFLSGLTSIVVGWSSVAATHYFALNSTPLSPSAAEAALAKMPASRQALYTYCIGLGIIATWRGVWVLWDAAYEKFTGVKAVDQPAMSGLLSHVVGTGILATSGYMASLMAPPLRLCVFNNADMWRFLYPVRGAARP
mmetsp:Transcript_18994/g.42515  ORF Transcript_18994/g.42515 Transcript_18994/m.42515 type:complete len:235 (-) Transcript_18994:20-724(-)